MNGLGCGSCGGEGRALENVLAGRMSDKQPSGKEGHTAAVVSNLYACT